MKFIIAIKGVMEEDYIRIRQDLTRQFIEREWDIPFFAHLAHAEYEDIEIIWIDKEMEKEKFAEIIKHQKELNEIT